MPHTHKRTIPGLKYLPREDCLHWAYIKLTLGAGYWFAWVTYLQSAAWRILFISFIFLYFLLFKSQCQQDHLKMTYRSNRSRIKSNSKWAVNLFHHNVLAYYLSRGEETEVCSWGSDEGGGWQRFTNRVWHLQDTWRGGLSCFFFINCTCFNGSFI